MEYDVMNSGMSEEEISVDYYVGIVEDDLEQFKKTGDEECLADVLETVYDLARRAYRGGSAEYSLWDARNRRNW